MDRRIEYIITKEQAGLTIVEVLKQKGFSTKLITYVKMLEKGLTIEGNQVLTNHIVHENERLHVNIIDDYKTEKIIPVKMDLDIVYEDEDIIIINKAANMPIHPSQGNYDNTLANGIAYYYKEKGENFIYRCINRLDRDTTGLLILAKNKLSACILANMVSKREIHREYLAVTEGIVSEEGTIIAPIARLDGSTIERCVNFDHGDYAKTFYKRIDYKDNYSLVALKLETGRTHQIRVHMKYIGHPLVGDTLYNEKELNSNMYRQALHSHHLGFKHPVTKKYKEFYSTLPNDMQKMFNNIEFKTSKFIV